MSTTFILHRIFIFPLIILKRAHMYSVSISIKLFAKATQNHQCPSVHSSESKSPKQIKINHHDKQDCLLKGQAQLDQRVIFHFSTLRLWSKKQYP